MGYNMKGFGGFKKEIDPDAPGTPGKPGYEPPVKRSDLGFDFKKRTKDYTSPKVKQLKREKEITKAHNIEAETSNPTGNTCMICGESRDSHSYTAGHQFKNSKK